MTVNAVLNVGAVAETVTVSESSVQLQFNTSTMELTVDRKMLTDLPILARNPASGRVTRMPFAGNRIPQNRMDPTSLRVLKDVWKPNGPGIDITCSNNYRIGYSWPMRYWNFSERVDWNISDKLKVFGRFSRVRTDPADSGHPQLEDRI